MTSSTQPGFATLERRGRAAIASDPAASRGRLVSEGLSPTRGEFQRDRDRIVHCTAFRRLAHKTQVFVPMQGDHFRTRLTHTIEVAQIARSLARAIGLDDDLAEAVALAHDLGHTPFGHTGEDALDAVMQPYGGFDHNAHALRIVTELERRYADFDGLNLAWETLEGLVKHNGPLTGDIPEAIADYDARHRLDLASHAGPEAQAAALADDIAYNAHDIDDGLRAGLFDIADLRAVPFLASLIDEIDRRHPGLERVRVIHELGRRVITRFVEDVIAETRRRAAGLASAQEVRRAGRATVAFSTEMAEADRSIKAFLFPNMYRHRSVVRVRAKADLVVRDLFRGFLAKPSAMPAEWQPAEGAPDDVRARAAADYIAGMTDRFALSEHRRLFDVTPELV